MSGEPAPPTAVWIRSKTGPIVGRALGYYVDACGHVVYPHLEIETVDRKFPRMWAHSGKGSTCHVSSWDADGYAPTPQTVNGRTFVPKKDSAELTFCAEDLIAFEPEKSIGFHRNAWSFGRPGQ